MYCNFLNPYNLKCNQLVNGFTKVKDLGNNQTYLKLSLKYQIVIHNH